MPPKGRTVHAVARSSPNYRTSDDEEGSSSEGEAYDFVEPEVAPNVSLKTTGLGLSDTPEWDSLLKIEDPERAKRQQGVTPPPRPHRRSRRATSPTDAADTAANNENGKLFLRLKRNLVTSVGEASSNLRETPPQTHEEDYRHRRDLAEPVGRRRPRRAKGAVFAIPPPRKTRKTRNVDYVDSETGDDSESYGATRGRLVTPASSAIPSSVPPSPIKSDASAVKVEAEAGGEGDKSDEPTSNGNHTLESGNKPVPGIINQDFCSSCGGTGDLLCCETCVRSFHFSCIEPPVMDVKEIVEDVWSCRECRPKHLSSAEEQQIKSTLFEPLIKADTMHNAVAFQLPLNLREMFANVDFTKHGEFLDEANKTPHAVPVHRIQNKDGDVLLCFKCRGNGLNDRSLAVCSRCHEPWHIDCLDPPLESTPFGFWTCPLHADKNGRIPRRVKAPKILPVQLPRSVRNNGDIEIDIDDEHSEGSSHGVEHAGGAAGIDVAHGEELTSSDGEGTKVGIEVPTDRTIVPDSVFEDEEVTEKITSRAPTIVLSSGDIVAKNQRQRPRGYESDRVVYKVPSRTIKLDFLDAVERERRRPYRQTPEADFMLGLNILANRPSKDSEAVRNLMLLGVSGPTVSQAQVKENLNVLVEAALDDDNEIGQIAAIRKLMKEKGKERLLELLQKI